MRRPFEKVSAAHVARNVKASTQSWLRILHSFCGPSTACVMLCTLLLPRLCALPIEDLSGLESPFAADALQATMWRMHLVLRCHSNMCGPSRCWPSGG